MAPGRLIRRALQMQRLREAMAEAGAGSHLARKRVPMEFCLRRRPFCLAKSVNGKIGKPRIISPGF
uniref:Uncharacterized protein n=1 Tax=Physcomitrium patens TaxID=3218 RepID=A0A7I3Z6U3_PHYPA